MADAHPTRSCKHCDVVLPLADFWNPRSKRPAKWCPDCLARRRAGTLQCRATDCAGKVYCQRLCRTHYERLRYSERRESIRAAARARYAVNPEPILTRNRAWDAANRERKAANDAAWRAANRERKRANDAAYYEANRDKIKSQAAEWYAANRDRAAESCKAWRAANADKRREAHAKRRALKAGAAASLTAAEWRDILDEFDHACAYCHARGSDLQQEHVTPLSRGGHHDRLNVVPACWPCNGRKGTKTLFEFLAS